MKVVNVYKLAKMSGEYSEDHKTLVTEKMPMTDEYLEEVTRPIKITGQDGKTVERPAYIKTGMVFEVLEEETKEFEKNLAEKINKDKANRELESAKQSDLLVKGLAAAIGKGDEPKKRRRKPKAIGEDNQ